jgi:predicted ATP-grasp superfamily ATP-dependent carboligase
MRACFEAFKNPGVVLSEKVENKISQVEWLGELDSFLPSHRIVEVKDIEWNKTPFVLQWSHGHTGDGTILIKDESELNALKEKFPYREARITDFINGPMFTVNIVVTKTVILLGNISYQITGMLPFTTNSFSTIGNDWSLPHTILTDTQLKNFESIAEKVAQKMQKEGWLGLFGIDVIYDQERDSLHLIEINARQPASTTFESELQNNVRIHGVGGITTFEAHLL